MVKRFLTTMVFLVILCPTLFVAPFVGAQGGRGVPSPGRSDVDLLPVLIVTPREIDLGALGPGEETRSVIYIKNIGSGTLEWSMEEPAGWTRLDAQGISGAVGDSPEPLKLHLAFLDEREPGKPSDCTLVLSIEGAGQKSAFRRVVPMGALREPIRIESRGGTRTVFFNVRLSERSSASLIDVEPLRMDFGTVRPVEPITKRMLIRNRGKEPLKWKVVSAGKKRASAQVSRGRFISFHNAASVGIGGYSVAGQFKNAMEFSGTWIIEGGFPVTQQGEHGALRYRFNGTGISLIIQKTPEGDPLMIYLNDQLVTLVDGYSERRERVEIGIAAELPEASHLLTVVSDAGRVVIEGVRIFGKPLMKGPPGWINIVPDSGITTRETDYVNIVLNTPKLAPGIYGEMIHVTSNGGDVDVEIYVEVVAETQARILDVHRYLAGSNYLYTTNPQAEASRLQAQGYRNLGIAFRLFAPGTQGTTDFFRWFNPAKGDHFYSSDPSGGVKPMAGYVLEGSIGNIATFRLTGTRELYRWRHPGSGRHFYTTDQAGEGLGKKGYRFDGIAGFVR